ncbi:hypothetical protein B0A50_01960 [Salinomyces thailandicus]|uniref:Zn(2)-C6 fungal-type domain-containing protein n=1 Tax=Salinomyces thailandicus TaxID=706561 RepID=A0A4U0U8K2_9PEZI|nr:hypothetical protein B0A50_01960 [Salinomyces thailandica]
MAEYKQGSPSSDMLNNVPGMASTTSGYGGGRADGDYSFGTPGSFSIDSMLQSGSNSATASTNMSGMPASMQQSFGPGVNTNIMPSPSIANGADAQRKPHASMPNTFDDTSPITGHRHRLSAGSHGHFANHERHGSMAGSDTTSPDAHGRPSFGDNAFAGNSNETGTAHNRSGAQADGGRQEDLQGAMAPAWSELKTKAGKERKRLPLACIACRRKKIRCSGEKPACKHCLRSRIPCVYKVTTRKAAPRTDYMAMLDKRLKRMEERVIKILPREDQAVVSSTGRAQVRPPLPPAPSKPSSVSKKRGADQAFGDELDGWANASDAEKKVDLTKDTTRELDVQTETLQTHEAEEQSLLREGTDKLPPKELQEHLTEVFFDYVYGQSYHLLHKPSFLRKSAQGTVPPVLMLAVCGISARFSNHPAVRTEPAFLRGESWASAARDIALRRYDTPSITILIVYLILGLHEFGTCQGGRSWMFGGMAQRMAYALQLHKDLDHDPKMRRGSEGKNREGDLTFTDREIRRRTMWSCFLMDRFNSSGTDRPIFVAEQYIRAQLPIKENYYELEITGPTEDLEGNVPNPVEPDTGQVSNPKDNMGVAAYLIRLVAIWGKLVHYLNLGGKDRDSKPMWEEHSVFQTILRDTETWRESLPESMKYSAENLENFASEKMANQFLFMHIVYNQIILFSNRFALPAPGVRTQLPKETPQDFIQSSSRAAFEAANQISTLVHESMDHLVVAPFAGYCAFFSSTVHIYGAFSKNPQLEATSKQNLAWNVKYLTKMKKYWGMFHFVTENLRDLYRRHADAARSGTGPRPAGGAEGEGREIFQYGDWFDRYPHGVSGTDYEEPVREEVKREAGADAVLGQKSDLQTVEEFFSKLSPPSRAAHLQAQQAQKKAAKKRRASKGDRSNTASSANGVAQTPGAQQQQPQGQQAFPQHQQSQHQPQRPPLQHHQHQSSNMVHDLAHLDALSQHSPAFPPNFQPPHNPLLSAPPQHLLSQLDRQMVLNSYAGLDPSAHLHLSHSSSFQHQQPHQPSHQPHHNHGHDQGLPDASALTSPFPLDPYSAYGTSNGNTGSAAAGGGGGGGLWTDPSTAWFMPFNMDPPSIGDDHNLFTHSSGSSNFDWANFAGFGDMGSGLGAGADGDAGNGGGGEGVDPMLSGTSSSGMGGAGLEGLEGLQ